MRRRAPVPPPVLARISSPRSRPAQVIIPPPRAAPTRNPASANSDALSENPGAPTAAKPANTTFPVMLATKTRPRDKMDTASTTPVTAVKISSRPGSGPNFGWASRDPATPPSAGRVGCALADRSPSVPFT